MAGAGHRHSKYTRRDIHIESKTWTDETGNIAYHDQGSADAPVSALVAHSVLCSDSVHLQTVIHLPADSHAGVLEWLGASNPGSDMLIPSAEDMLDTSAQPQVTLQPTAARLDFKEYNPRVQGNHKCKRCDRPAAASNYGFCVDHRQAQQQPNSHTAQNEDDGAELSAGGSGVSWWESFDLDHFVEFMLEPAAASQASHMLHSQPGIREQLLEWVETGVTDPTGLTNAHRGSMVQTLVQASMAQAAAEALVDSLIAYSHTPTVLDKPVVSFDWANAEDLD